MKLSFFAKMKGGASRAACLSALVLIARAASAEGVCDVESCVGDMARACWVDDVSQAGLCLGEELSHWAQRYDAVRQALVADGAAIEAVNDSSSAFLSYRQVACADEDAALRGGSGSGEDWAECMIDLTATQVLTLEQILVERQ